MPVQRIYRHRQRLVEERQAKEAKAAGRPPPGVAGQKAQQQPAHHGGQSVRGDAASRQSIFALDIPDADFDACTTSRVSVGTLSHQSLILTGLQPCCDSPIVV